MPATTSSPPLKEAGRMAPQANELPIPPLPDPSCSNIPCPLQAALRPTLLTTHPPPSPALITQPASHPVRRTCCIPWRLRQSRPSPPATWHPQTHTAPPMPHSARLLVLRRRSKRAVRATAPRMSHALAVGAGALKLLARMPRCTEAAFKPGAPPCENITPCPRRRPAPAGKAGRRL